MTNKWVDLTPQQQAAYVNGIGPAWFPKALRDGITGFCSRFFREASWGHHDFGYTLGGTEIDRINCDGRFLIAMRRDVHRCRWRYKPVSWVLCHGFYLAVRLCGRRSFNYITTEEIKSQIGNMDMNQKLDVTGASDKAQRGKGF